MIEYKRSLLANKYHQLTIQDCPREIILVVANLEYVHAYLENFRYSLRDDFHFRLEIGSNHELVFPLISEAVVDFQVTKSDFLKLIDIFDQNGCYAVLHNSSMIKFKVTELDEVARYKALDNFKWVSEIAIPGSASNGIGTISSPKKEIIDLIEAELEKNEPI